MATLRTTFILSLAAAIVSACKPDIAGPEASLEGLPEGLQVELVVDPAVVGPHEPFTARLSVTNTTTSRLTVVTNHGCLAIPHVMRNETRVPFEGSWWGCTAAITTHVFAPGETRTHTWNMRAELYAEHPGEVDGVAAPRGVYQVRAEFEVYLPDGRKPAVQHPLEVR